MALFFSWMFAAVIGEFAVLMFLMYRRHHEVVLRLMFAMFGLFSAGFCLLAIVMTLTAKPLEWTMREGLAMTGVAAMLFAFIVLLARWDGTPSFKKNALGEAARARYEANPPKKRSCLFDLIGCVVIGAVLVVGLVVLVALGSGMANL